MTSWRVVIADDEPLARRGVRQLLAAHAGFTVVRECRDGHEARQALEANEADLLFLDIAMPGLDGVEVARRRADPQGAVIVFLTAHSTRAVEAFEADATDYLVKPVSAERFARTIERVRRQLERRRTTRPALTLLANSNRGTRVIPAAEVEWIEGANHYARVWHQARGHLVRESLDALEGRLAMAGFIRVHRSALVRLGAIERLDRRVDTDARIVLRSGAALPVARRRLAQVAAALRRSGQLPG